MIEYLNYCEYSKLYSFEIRPDFEKGKLLDVFKALMEIDKKLLQALEQKEFMVALKALIDIFDCKLAQLLFIDGSAILDSHSHYQDEPIKITNRYRQNVFMNRVRPGVSKNEIVIKNGETIALIGDIVIENAIYFFFCHDDELYALLQIGKREAPFDNEIKKSADYILTHLSPYFYFYHRILLRDKNKRETELALRESETIYKSIFDNTLDLIYQADCDGNILRINKNGASLLGSDNEESLIGRNIKSFHIDGDWNRVYKDKMRILGYVKNFEVILHNMKGKTIFCVESSFCIKNGMGETQSLIGTIKDVTHRIESDKELWRTNLELVKINELLRLMCANVKDKTMSALSGFSRDVAAGDRPFNQLMDELKQNLTDIVDWQKTDGELYPEDN